MKKFFLFCLVFGILIAGVSLASSGGGESSQITADIVPALFWIAVVLIAAKVSGLIERFGQPSVLGELIIGVVLGNLYLLGFHFFEPIKINTYFPLLAELGVIILLFQVGLESNISQMKKVGVRALMVATVGVICPFILGTYIVGPYLLPGLSSNAYLFLGAALTATSVGITARVFKDLGKLHTKEAQIVLGAAVIDDVMGLVILAVVSAIATLGAVSFGGVSLIVIKAVGFLLGAIILGQIFAPHLGKLFSKIHTGVGMKFALAISICFVVSFIAGKIGLAPIVGAFAAGLVLDSVHFKYFKKPKVVEELLEVSKDLSHKEKEKLVKIAENHSEKHIEDLIEPLAHFFVPIFFIITGMNVRLETLFDSKILLVALAITLVAVIGKYVSGFVAGRVNKQIVGFGMVPRGEVGLIFASIGSSLGVITKEMFSVIVIMVILTTLITPPILTYFLKKNKD